MIKKSPLRAFFMPKNLHDRTFFVIFALVVKRLLPHQSRLGNSSNTNEMPRQAFALMASPNLYEVFFGQGGLQRS